MILYEYPFNERLRTYLRLEQLYRRLRELLTRAHSVDHHFALITIFEIMDVASRSDLRADIIRTWSARSTCWTCCATTPIFPSTCCTR